MKIVGLAMLALSLSACTLGLTLMPNLYDFEHPSAAAADPPGVLVCTPPVKDPTVDCHAE